MAKVNKIIVRLQTKSPGGGTTDPVYLGIITTHGGREFPLRYTAAGLEMASDETYRFGVNAPELDASERIYDSGADGRNGINAWPLIGVERVYLRKEPRKVQAEADDALWVGYVAAFLYGSDDLVVDWSNRNGVYGSGPTPFWLSNESGQIVYLTPEIAGPSS